METFHLKIDGEIITIDDIIEVVRQNKDYFNRLKPAIKILFDAESVSADTIQEYTIVGYCIYRNTKYATTHNEKEWIGETGFQLEYIKKRLYEHLESAEDAQAQLQKNEPNAVFEIRPVYGARKDWKI